MLAVEAIRSSVAPRNPFSENTSSAAVRIRVSFSFWIRVFVREFFRFLVAVEFWVMFPRFDAHFLQ